jgi:hypothetical protein
MVSDRSFMAADGPCGPGTEWNRSGVVRLDRTASGTVTLRTLGRDGLMGAMHPTRAALLVFPLFALAACGAPPPATVPAEVRFGQDVPAGEADVLRQAAALELLALDPAWPTPAQVADPARFHGYAILGRATVTDEATRTRALDLIGQACRENDGMVAACFDPRHGVRAVHGSRTVDLVICFECLTVKVFADGALVNNGDLAETQEPELSALYRAAGLTIAP